MTSGSIFTRPFSASSLASAQRISIGSSPLIATPIEYVEPD
jgi:hypothetical protein